MFQPNNPKMDSSTTFLNDLPPLKRLRLLQQQQQQQQEHHYYDSSSPLPAKKRKESRTLSPPSPTTTKTVYNYSRPVKKRVWALQPQSPPSNDIVPAFDFNVEYTPSPNKLGDSEEDNSEEEDGVLCCVCQSTDGDPTDPIVFCDGCDLMVHASCYGTPLSKSIPDGDWFCERCRFRFEKNNVCNINCNACALCPSTDGAMKRTSAEEEGDASWAHVVCALFVPEVFFLDPEGREGIDFSKVPKKRWEERCYLCGRCEGCALVCSEPKCGLGFHVTCALKEELWIEYREGKKAGTIVAGFCKKHTQVWEKQQQSGKYKIVAVEDEK